MCLFWGFGGGVTENVGIAPNGLFPELFFLMVFYCACKGMVVGYDSGRPLLYSWCCVGEDLFVSMCKVDPVSQSCL